MRSQTLKEMLSIERGDIPADIKNEVYVLEELGKDSAEIKYFINFNKRNKIRY